MKKKKKTKGKLNVYYLAKEASLYTVWVQLYDICKRQNYRQ